MLQLVTKPFFYFGRPRIWISGLQFKPKLPPRSMELV